jgi:S-formylglutathione hydrolase FrmB
MSLTGTPLLVLLASLTVIGPVLVILSYRRRGLRVLPSVVRFVGVLGCQAVAVALVGVLANNAFGFYSSWSDILGGQTQLQQAVVADGLVASDGSQGTVITLSASQSGPVAAGASRRLPVLVWLPPQYSKPQYQQTEFPVTMMLPGQPGTPEGVFRQFDFAAEATSAIESGAVKPFVAVFPPLMVDPPRDTECTNVPNGPQAETWLFKDVRNVVLKRVRVSPKSQDWSAMGWSTGGFCAAKLLLRHRDLFNAAVGFGAYYDSETDRTTGKLFGNSQKLRNENSPLWLIQHPPGQRTNLLIVVSKQDRASYGGIFYADSKTMISQSAGTPGVSTILMPTGGHNYRVYRATMPQVLAWLSRNAGL